MRKKQPALIITFATTTQAMAPLERFCAQRGLPGRLIPVPREITAGCGLSWKALPEEKEMLLSAMEEGNLKSAECHCIEV